jgi:L-alanine-DL-glutamate epimerase-like enolase superfamily enzyme
MQIRDIEVFQVNWAPEDKPAQRSAWVRIHCDDGLSGIGEASPMQGGLASLGIVAHNLAPALIGKDPLDHAVLHDTLLHTFVKLGPEGALTGALANSSAGPGVRACRSTHRSAAMASATSMRSCGSSKHV